MSHENFVFFGLDRTGGVIVLLRYLRALAARGDVVSITTLGRAGDKRFLPIDANVPARYLGLRSRPYKAAVRFSPGHLGFPALEQRRLSSALPECDLHVATYSLTASVVAAAAPPSLYHAQHFEPLIMQYPRARRLAEESYRLPLYLTANCTWVADRIADAGGSVRGLVMPGIDHAVFTPTTEPLPDSGRFRVVTLSKRAEWKGLVDVIAGVGQLARSSSAPVDLVAYGPDPLAGDASPAVVEQHGLVAPDALAALLRDADACVSGSWYESFPLPPLEGMACGTPVVCTRLGTEDYAHDEVNCLIVPPRDPDAIRAALERIRDDADLRAELVRNGLDTARQFSWAHAEAQFLQHVDAARA